VNKQETSKLIAMIMEEYPKAFNISNAKSLECKVNLWQRVFADDDFTEAVQAFEMFLANDIKGFPPVPGQLKYYIAQKVMKDTLTEQEAWDLVRSAISRGLYHSREEYEKLPEEVRKSVGGSGNIQAWANLDTYMLDGDIRRDFMRRYRQEVDRTAMLVKLPIEARQELLPKMERTLLDNGSIDKKSPDVAETTNRGMN